MTSRELGEQGEIGRRLDPGGRDAHQAGDRQARAARCLEQGRQVRDRAAALLRLVADIDLEEAVGAAAGLAPSPWRAPSTSEGRSTEWIASNRATASSALLDWSWPIRWSGRSGWRARRRRPFGLRLLHAILAKFALALRRSAPGSPRRAGSWRRRSGSRRPALAPGERRRAGRSGPDVSSLCAVKTRHGGCYRKRHARAASLCRASG